MADRRAVLVLTPHNVTVINPSNGGPRRIGNPPATRRRRGGWVLVAAAAAVFFGGGTLVSYYVNALWFDSLGYGSVFWTRLDLQAGTFVVFAGLTFVAIYGAFLALKPRRFDELVGGRILINQQWVAVPVEPVLKLVALGLALVIALANGGGMSSNWNTFALFWDAPRAASTPDPIFGRPLGFYLFTLPAWQLIAGWLLTLAVIGCLIAGVLVLAVARARGVVERGFGAAQARLWRGLAITVAVLLLVLAVRAYLGRYERLFQDNTVFSGVDYTDAHITLDGMLVVCAALVAGAAIALYTALHSALTTGLARPRPRWLLARGGAGDRLLHHRRPGWLVRQQFHRQAEPAGARAAFHRAQHRDDPSRLRARSHRAACVPGGDQRRRARRACQPGDARQYPAVGLARAAGHAAPDPGDPHLLRFP
jgi:hypothetical protein